MPTWWLVTIFPGLLAGVIALYGWLVRTPRRMTEPVRDCLIVAAHPDDCVIVAGEYAIEAARIGRSVQVAYLTCGDRQPGSDRAIRRRAEAIDAWASVGVPTGNLHFIDLPNSPLAGPSILTEDQLAHAGAFIQSLVATLPPHAAVFMPAEGESHVDHRTLRDLCIDALRQSARHDLTTYQAAEYNGYYSLWHSPARTIVHAISVLPVVGRFMQRAKAWQPAGFIHGDAGTIMPADDARLAQKRDMLRKFVSEDGELLVRLFGHRDRYQRIDAFDPRATSKHDGYLPWGDHHIGMSVVAMWFGVFASVFILLRMATGFAVRELSAAQMSAIAQTLVVLLGLSIAVRAMFKGQQPERRALYIAASAGVLAGLI